MKIKLHNQQIIAIITAIALVSLLFFFGKTVSDKPVVETQKTKEVKPFDIQSFISESKSKNSPENNQRIASLEAEWLNSSLPDSVKLRSLKQLAAFWRDSLRNNIIHLYYISETTKLDNSEKNLNFAAQLILSAIQAESNPSVNEWESNLGISLFEKAIEKNPENDDSKIGLAGCYIYGKGRNGDPQQTMKGIQELLGVVRRDSLNMKAQLMLGVGGIASRQYDKALLRFRKVLDAEPDNLEAIYFLANVYTTVGPKDSAVLWLKKSQLYIRDPEYIRETNEQLKKLEQKTN